MYDTDYLEFLVSVANMTFLSLAEKNIILNNAGDAKSLSEMSLDDISKIIRRSFLRAKFDGAKNLLLAKRAAKLINALQINVLKNDDANFPAMLREIHDTPFLLYCRGDIKCLRQKSVSVVGTREITPSGIACAKQFAHDAAADGFTVISGLAHGVDAEAHKGALDAFYDALEIDEAVAKDVGRTCAVLPGGIDEIVPHSHKNLAQKIVSSGGLLMSECPPGVPVEKWRFVSRNRIVAALSPVTVVVEAPPASGALITAEMALDYGRDLVLMESAFCNMAKQIAAQKLQVMLQKKTQKKHIATVEQLAQDGAAIIKNFSDYKKWLSEKPGERQPRLDI